MPRAFVAALAVSVVMLASSLATMGSARELARPRVRTVTVRITHRMLVGRLVQIFGRPDSEHTNPRAGTGCFAYRGDDGKWNAMYCIHPKARPTP